MPDSSRYNYNIKLIVQATPQISEPYNTKYLLKSVDKKLRLPFLNVGFTKTSQETLDDLVTYLIDCDPKWIKHSIKLLFIDDKFVSEKNIKNISAIYGYMMMPEMEDVFINDPDCTWVSITELMDKKEEFYNNDFYILQKGMTMI